MKVDSSLPESMDNREAVATTDDRPDEKELYEEILKLKLSEDFLNLPERFTFPVCHPERPEGGHQFITRDAHWDCLMLFLSKFYKRRGGESMLVIGPSGVAKSWGAMLFIIALIKLGITVIYERADFEGRCFVFGKGKSQCALKSAVAQLFLDPKTVYLYDCIASMSTHFSICYGYRVIFSSNNEAHHKQLRGNSKVIRFFMASTSNEEFQQYCEFFGVDYYRQQAIAHYCGTGKIRPIAFDADNCFGTYMGYIETAILGCDIERMKRNAEIFDESVNVTAASSILFDGYCNPTAIKLFPVKPKSQAPHSPTPEETLPELVNLKNKLVTWLMSGNDTDKAEFMQAIQEHEFNLTCLYDPATVAWALGSKYITHTLHSSVKVVADGS